MMTEAQQHACHITNSADGIISSKWCINHFASTLASFPPNIREEDIARPELLIHDERVGTKRVQIYYTPFDLINSDAKVLLVGITPGRTQLYLASMAARRAILGGRSLDEAVRSAKKTASFAGSMRSNAIGMLDSIGVSASLGIASTASLFDEHSPIAGMTSAICHAVFVNGANYTGHGLGSLPIIDAFTTQVLGAELELTPRALVIPFGKAASQAIEQCVETGRVESSRCLLGFPHPSGANGHRRSQFTQERQRLAQTVNTWAANSLT